jgi:uncharacterized small protein (DUF1192 family)
VDSSSQASSDQFSDFETFMEAAKAKIAKLRHERNEARLLSDSQSAVHNAALTKVAELEAALNTLQHKIPRTKTRPARHEVHLTHSPRNDSKHVLLSELHSLSKGVKSLEKRNAQLTSLVNRYPTFSDDLSCSDCEI